MTDASIALSPQVVTRKDAKAKSLKFYFTGKPCKYGHVDKRITVDGSCYACKLRQAREWKSRNADHVAAYKKTRESLPDVMVLRKETRRKNWAENPEKFRSAHKAYRAKNPQSAREWNINWKSKNRERLRLEALAYYEANKDACDARNREYARVNPERARAINRTRRARQKAASGVNTAKDVDDLFTLQMGLCVGCDADLRLGFHVDHKLPLSRGGSNWPENLQLLCPPCNHSKGAKTPAEWAKARGETE